MRIPFAILTLGLGLLACDSNAPTVETHVDAGQACFCGAADEPHSVEIVFPTCISSSCGEIVESMCEVTRSGTELTIHASATTSTRSGACTNDCGPVRATCETEPLPAGDYELVYGDLQGTLTVPAVSSDPSCIGEDWYGGVGPGAVVCE